MNGPTERETTWALRDAMGRRALSEADREQADLRARVAVLEQQIAAIEALVQRYAADINRPDAALFAIQDVAAVLAAGVVDNPTEDEANADPFTLDDLGHPTEGSPS